MSLQKLGSFGVVELSNKIANLQIRKQLIETSLSTMKTTADKEAKAKEM